MKVRCSCCPRLVEIPRSSRRLVRVAVILCPPCFNINLATPTKKLPPIPEEFIPEAPAWTRTVNRRRHNMRGAIDSGTTQ